MTSSYIPAEKLVRGCVYFAEARNGGSRAVGLYLGDETFLFRHVEWGTETLQEEFLARELGGSNIPFDTVYPYESLGSVVKSDIPLPDCREYSAELTAEILALQRKELGIPATDEAGECYE